MRPHAPLLYLWTLPNTLLGLLPVPILLLQRSASVRIHSGVVELTGGLIAVLLTRFPAPVKPCALTLGHVVWAIDDFHLTRTRAHERIHVRQYERWGPFFLPAYFGFSLWLHLKGKDYYRDNPFEREAYDNDNAHAAGVGD